MNKANPSMGQTRPPTGARPPVHPSIEEYESALDQQDFTEPAPDDEPDQSTEPEEAEPSARFDDFKLSLRELSARRCIIEVDIDLALGLRGEAGEGETAAGQADEDDREGNELHFDADDLEPVIPGGAPRRPALMGAPMAARAGRIGHGLGRAVRHRPTIRLADIRFGKQNGGVLTVQKALARAVGLDYSSGPGTFGPRTRAAYARWQRRSGVPATGRPDVTSLRKLGEKDGFSVDARAPHPRPPTRWKLDREKFFHGYRTAFGRLGQSQVEGLNALLAAAEADPTLSDLRWLAYMFSTVQHECAGTWRPIEEYGKGAGRPYGTPVVVTDPQGKKHRNVYYGRGYVQLTWRSNYEKMGRLLKNRLLYNPALALRPAVAYRIMSLGMRRGIFTGKKLGDYIAGARRDYVNARRIINGRDQAEKLARNAVKFEKILRNSVIR
jgi:hypothetical protein